ncbi:MAG: YrdB family protein [Chloroflexi bacterium]|nr:YrdB family protein [Chloroflexota bacterium]
MHSEPSSPLQKVNLGLRFVLEIAMFASFCVAPAVAIDGVERWPLTVLTPIAAIAIWGVFATPDDPSRSGKTVIPTAGSVRLIIELVLFTGAAAVMAWAGLWPYSVALLVATTIHYTLWPARIRWLLSN